MNRTIFCIFSKNFFGAERRYFKIFSLLGSEKFSKYSFSIIINSSLYVSARKIEWASVLMDRWASSGRLAIIPDRVSHLHFARNLSALFVAIGGSAPVHAILRARYIAYARALFGRAASIEVTSSDVAKQVAAEVPVTLLKRLISIHCVSISVRDRLLEEVSRRGAEASASIRTSFFSSPFFIRPDRDADFSSKRNVIVSASRFIPRKNVLLIAEALAIALPNIPNWSAVLRGQGEQELEIKRVLGPLIVQGRVEVGYSPTIESDLSISKIYVSMITPDNYPSQAVIEAMHFGNALIVGNTGQSHRFIDGNKNGYLIDPSPNSLAEKIVELALAQDKLEEMGRASIEHLGTAFSPESHIREVLEIHHKWVP